MAKQTIGLGTAPTGVGGDTPRSAFTKTQSNIDELYAALGGDALPDALPVSKGGTGGTNQAAARTNLGLGQADKPTLGSLELSSSTPYVDFHLGSGTTDYDVRLINDASNRLSCTGDFNPRSILTRPGINGVPAGFRFTIDWVSSTGLAALWIDATRIGNIQTATSDYRIKKNIKSVELLHGKFMERINSYRVVEYEIGNFSVWKGDGTVFQGLIAHEAQEVNPLAATGVKDAVEDDGTPIVQELNPMALITDLIGAIKELRAEVNALKVSARPTPEAPISIA